MQNSGQGQYPVDDATYNLLQMLVSKLEAIEAYSMYLEDLSGEAAQVVERIQQDDQRHAEDLVRLLGISQGGQR